MKKKNRKRNTTRTDPNRIEPMPDIYDTCNIWTGTHTTQTHIQQAHTQKYCMHAFYYNIVHKAKCCHINMNNITTDAKYHNNKTSPIVIV